MTEVDDLEEYWAVARPIRFPPPDPIETPTIETALKSIEFWVSLIDDQGREQTPRIRVGALTGTFIFPPVAGPIHIARMALWISETAEVPSRHVALELGVSLLAGDTPRVTYNIDLDAPFTTRPIRGFQSSSP